MIKVCVCGACGKMGQRIIANILVSGDMCLSSAVETKGHSDIGKDVGSLLHIEPLGIKITDNAEDSIKNCDCVIDFSTPQASLEHLKFVVNNKKAFVLGTTGFDTKAIEEIRKASKEIACVFSPNMSTGVNILFKLVREIAPMLKDYDIEIVETHHNMKKDAPSGTALKIAQVISDALNLDLEKNAVYGRKGNVGARKQKEIGIHAVRMGDVFGEHTVSFACQGERIELTHKASSRDALAIGAVKAARFASKAKSGLYDMEQVLGMSKKSIKSKK